MIYKTEPENFISRFEIVSCYVEHDGKILILHRQNHKPQGNTWGLPAGKIDDNEDKIEAMLREIFEERICCIRCRQHVRFVDNYTYFPQDELNESFPDPFWHH